MRLSRIAFGILLFSVVPETAWSGELTISEFMAINDLTLQDRDGDSSDWIEMENDGPGAVDAGGWYLSDDPADLMKWQIPPVEIPGDSRLVVFASGKDRTDAAAGPIFDVRESSTFAHRLEFDSDGVIPSVEGGADNWQEEAFNIDAAAAPSLSVSGGVLRFDTVGVGGGHDIRQPGDSNNGNAAQSAWESEIGINTSYTFEARVRVTAQGGSAPGFNIWLGTGDASDTVFLSVETNRVVWARESVETALFRELHRGDNSSDFVVIRVAHDGATGKNYVWRNGLLIGDGLGRGLENLANNWVILIDHGARDEVRGELDYVRWVAGGAFSPPNSVAGMPEFHTSFRLDGDGEYLALVRPDGTVASEFAPTYPPQRRDVSYGAEGFFLTPTPGEPNTTTVEGFVSDPEFSAGRGFYDGPVNVTLSSATPDVAFRYTTDGTPPSPTHGTEYDGPIWVDTTTTLRVIGIKPDFGPSRVVTHTYLFPADILRQTGAGFPVNDDWDYQVDPNVVNDPRFAAGMEDSLKSLPVLSLVLPVEDMFGPSGIHANPTATGFAWERETSAELILPDGQPGFQVNCGVRIHGAGSRRRALGKKSFRLAFRQEYGPGKLRFPFFGPDGPDEFDGLVVRGNYFDTWSVHTSGNGESIGWLSALLLRDAFGSASQFATGHLGVCGRWVQLYIDGLYWGIYHVVERPDEEFAATHLGGSPEDYDVLKHGNETVAGDRTAWNELLNLVKGNITSPAVYAAVEERLAMVPFIDYIILNLYGGNQDWPHNNWYVMRSRPENAPFRFVAWDTENFIFLLNEAGKLTTNVDNSPGILYDRLRRNADFQLRFADRVHRHLFNGGAFSPDAAAERFESIADEIRPALDAEAARWGDTRVEPPLNRIDTWEPVVAEKLGRYFPQRTGIALNQFRSIALYPDIEAPSFNQHGGSIDPGFVLGIQAPAGQLFFTLDGTDPRAADGGVASTATEVGSEGLTLIETGATVEVFVPQDGSLGLTWTDVDFADLAWRVGTTGVGYERSSGFEDFINTDVVDEMYNKNESIYMRIPFDLKSAAGIAILTLRVQFDDGFVAYLNGVPVASRHAPEPGELTWNSGATRGNSDSAAIVFESIDISDHVGALRPGRNVLAIHGLNSGINSSDALWVPELKAVSAGDTGLVLQRSTLVKSRTLAGGEWSALNEAIFMVDSTGLKITELMYNPRPAPEGSPWGNDQFEFVELQNVGGEPIHLVGAQLTGAVEFSFPVNPDPELYLQPNEFVLVVKNREAFESRYDTTDMRIAGEYSGNFNNGGERVVLLDAVGSTLLDFQYFDTWYPNTDGGGRSLEIEDARAAPEAWADQTQWFPSLVEDGTPGRGRVFTVDGRQLPSDMNQDADIDISDALSLLLFLFTDSPVEPPCGDGSLDAAGNVALLDANGDAAVNLADAIHLLNYLFGGGTRPVLGASCIRLQDCPDVCQEE